MSQHAETSLQKWREDAYCVALTAGTPQGSGPWALRDSCAANGHCTAPAAWRQSWHLYAVTVGSGGEKTVDSVASQTHGHVSHLGLVCTQPVPSCFPEKTGYNTEEMT
jgi:hypothetical protein